MSHRDEPSDATYVGGLRWSGGNATWPLVRLQLKSDGLRVHPSLSPLRMLVPAWHVPWSDVIRAERVQGTFPGSPGVRFYIQDRQHPFTFWCWRPKPILDALAGRGVAVDYEKHRVGLLGT
jgi:hypothetical protein